MTNANYRYSAKEIEQFIQMWNDGVPTKDMATHFRRTKRSITQMALTLRQRGYQLKHGLDRIEALRYARQHADHLDGVRALEESLLTDDEPSETPEPPSSRFGEFSSWSTEPPFETKVEQISPPDDVEPAEEPIKPEGRVEITTIMTIDGKEVSRATTVTRLVA